MKTRRDFLKSLMTAVVAIPGSSTGYAKLLAVTKRKPNLIVVFTDDYGFDKVFYKNSNRPGIVNIDLEGNDVPLRKEATGMYHLDASYKYCVNITSKKKHSFF